jgi:hypothetical protein
LVGDQTLLTVVKFFSTVRFTALWSCLLNCRS